MTRKIAATAMIELCGKSTVPVSEILKWIISRVTDILVRGAADGI